MYQYAYSGCHTYYEVQNWCQQGPWNVWIFANHSFNVITRLQKRIVINRTRTALLQSLFITWSRDVVSFIYGNTGCGVSSLDIQNPKNCFSVNVSYDIFWNGMRATEFGNGLVDKIFQTWHTYESCQKFIQDFFLTNISKKITRIITKLPIFKSLLSFHLRK